MTARFDLSGRVALVTGSTRGLGKAMARALAEHGARAVIHGRDGDRAAAVAESLQADGLQAGSVGFDVADRDACAEGVARVVADSGRIDILVNNAGIIHRQAVTELADADWQKVVDVNLTAGFVLARGAARDMLDRGWGRIINIASIMAQVARPTIPPYVSTKHGLAGLTRALAVELGPKGITCNAINPGYFATDINEALIADKAFDSMVKSRTPTGRWGRPEDLGGAAVFLASDAAAYVNGVMLTVDGGMTAALY